MVWIIGCLNCFAWNNPERFLDMLNSFLAACAVFFLTSFILALVLTPFCIWLAHKIGFLDIPACEQHKQHKKATPLLGGLAMYLAFGLTFFLQLGFWYFFKDSRFVQKFQHIADGLLQLTSPGHQEWKFQKDFLCCHIRMTSPVQDYFDSQHGG